MRSRLRSGSFDSAGGHQEKNHKNSGDDVLLQQGNKSDKENGDDDDTTLGNFRRYSSRKRTRTNRFLIETFEGRSYAETTDTKTQQGDEESQIDHDDNEEEEEEEEEEKTEGEQDRRYPRRKRRQVRQLEPEQQPEENNSNKGYSLRRNRRQRVPFNAKPEAPRPSRQPKKNSLSRWIEKEMREEREMRKQYNSSSSFTHKKKKRRRRRRHFDSSSESSSSEEYKAEYDREERGFRDYQKRKEQEDLDRIRPLNMGGGTSEKLNNRDLLRADANPVEIDRTIDWSHVGGLEGHVRTLKEMVVLPLMYPEVFERFKMQPPRGVIFHGPPGTGKTLVARALANSCCVGEKRVAFFMRKGADVVSKWVGEAERQLRLLFEQAKRHQPSIIFFDEIDGLAPVRSSKQDQVHASIVATLLALMDGLDARGQVVVVAATNRIDAIDPALRRPGRFDRELLFSLPNEAARAKIFEIHTRGWKPPPTAEFRDALAKSTVGFCGADIKQLCVEAALASLRRCFPQVYSSEHKLVLDPSTVTPVYRDFVSAMKRVVPAARRMDNDGSSLSKPLGNSLVPLLGKSLEKAAALLQPFFENNSKNKNIKSRKDEDEFYIVPPVAEARAVYQSDKMNQDLLSKPLHMFRDETNTVGCSRLLVCGPADVGQSQIISALLHRFGTSEMRIFSLSMPSLISSMTTQGATCLSEVCLNRLTLARRSAPSIVLLPRIELLWEASPRVLQIAIRQWFEELPRSCPTLVLASSALEYDDIPEDIRAFFGKHFDLKYPDEESQQAFFEHIVRDIDYVVIEDEENQGKTNTTARTVTKRRRKKLERVQITPKSDEVIETAAPLLGESDEHHLRELRVFFRECCNEIQKNRRFKSFVKPVSKEDVPDYYDVIKNPMCIDMMFDKIDSREYVTLGSFMADLKLIGDNVREYNPKKDPIGLRLLRNAAAMIDAAESMAYNFKRSLGYNLFKKCDEIYHRNGGKIGYNTSSSLYRQHSSSSHRRRQEQRSMQEGRPNFRLEDICYLCLKGDRPDDVLLCDSVNCNRECHMDCLRPALTEVPQGEWFCPHCRADKFDTESRDGNDYVGVTLTRYFNGDKPVKARVEKYLAPRPSHPTDVPIWHIRHEDGDEEDLEQYELETAMLASGDFVGQGILRFFEGKPVRGIVTEYLPGEPFDLWHVVHEDSDEEDLEQHEVIQAYREYRTRIRGMKLELPPKDKNLSTSAMRNLLTENGWYIESKAQSHYIYHSPDGTKVFTSLNDAMEQFYSDADVAAANQTADIASEIDNEKMEIEEEKKVVEVEEQGEKNEEDKADPWVSFEQSFLEEEEKKNSSVSEEMIVEDNVEEEEDVLVSTNIVSLRKAELTRVVYDMIQIKPSISILCERASLLRQRTPDFFRPFFPRRFQVDERR